MNNSGDSISLESVQEVKLDNLFKKHIKKLIAKDKNLIQVDYDTDEEEDYSIQPEWIENREIFNDELEDFIKPNKYLRKIPLSIGSTRKELKENVVSQMLGYEEQEAQITGQLKFIALKSKGEDYKSLYKYKQEVELQKKKMIGESYTCRIYVTRGIHVGGEGNIQDLFLQMKVDGQNLETWNETLKQKHLKKDTNNPDFYVSYDFDIVLPGSAILTLQVWSDQMALFGGDELVGQTKIDIEDRYFSDKWNAINKACYSQQKEKKFKMPMEQRNLVLPDTAGSVGRLECWIEVIPKKDLKFNAPLYIFPPPQYEFELRVIVWSTRNCVFKDEFEECNDVYVKGGLAKGSENQETDIHWRCRNKGNFNYRMKFKVKYPMVSEDDYGNDKFQVSIWDKDILGADELIGEQTINLNYHQLINKAVVRDKKTQMRTALYTEEDGVIAPFVSDKKKKKGEQDKKKEDNNIIFVDKDGNSVTTTNRIWFEVFNTFANLDEDGDVIENAVNIPQGEVELSFELVPLAIAAEEQNALGRNAPNQFPFLPEPAGRFSFDILHPCDFLKEIIGPNNYRKMWIIICTVFILTFLIWFGIVFFNNYIAVWAAK
ncbi:C2 domain [Pseudocohnilembus persalinus]|uniref:C2 domain n=1 Tax=Pseudocohnilembus persalinus TaxID=266149 RepID=A0A0V0QT28_PSEPJ|nr:C2 domain [Pseudocohnilembus persalinus]|eukprot:KRX05452.1 C2 domain [Pseudocohnilembus persalinus]